MKNSNLILNVLGTLLTILLLSHCETEEIEIIVPEQNADTSMTAIYQQTGLMFFDVELPNGCKLRSYFIDRDFSGFYTEGVDTIYAEDEICPGDLCIPYWGYLPVENDCDTLYHFDCDGNVLLRIPLCPEIVRDTVEVPVVPEITTQVIPYGELCNIWIVYADGVEIDRDTACGNNSVDTVTVNDTTKIERIRITEYFDNPGNTPFYESLGWKLQEGFSANNIGSNNKNGTFVCHTESVMDTAWSPKLLKDYELDYFSFRNGSRSKKHFLVLGKSSENIYLMDDLQVEGILGFDWTSFNYFNLFEYYLDVSLGIEKIGWFVYPSEKCHDRNDQWNTDVFVYSGYRYLD